jgi:hypothetical protein
MKETPILNDVSATVIVFIKGKLNNLRDVNYLHKILGNMVSEVPDQQERH